MSALICPRSPAQSGQHYFDQLRHPHACVHCGLAESDYVEARKSASLPMIATDLLTGAVVSDEGTCTTCRQLIDIYGGCQCGVRGTDGPGPHPAGTAGVNDDLAAFGEIVSEPASRDRHHAQGERAKWEAEDDAQHELDMQLVGIELGHHARIRRLLIELRDAHAACDASWRRYDGDRPIPLAERILGMRQMINDYEQWMKEAEADKEEFALNGQFEPVESNLGYIVALFIGAIVGVFLAWGFLVLR